MTWIKVAVTRWDQGTPALDMSNQIVEILIAKGWHVRMKGGRISWVNPITRTMRLAGFERRSEDAAARLLAHEFTHVRQFDGPLWRRCWRGLLYLLVPSIRVAVEVEAKAHALLAWARMCRTAEIGRTVTLRGVRVGSLAGCALPYLTGADRSEVAARIAHRAEELIDG